MRDDLNFIRLNSPQENTNPKISFASSRDVFIIAVFLEKLSIPV